MPAGSHSIFTIPPGLAFVDTLAGFLLAEAGGDPLALAEMEVLLPNRRAARSLREAFLRLSGGKPLLLPRMRAVDAVDEDELTLSADDPIELPPAVSELERQLLLTRLVLAMGEARGGARPSPDQAARLAGELGALLDAVQIERLDFSGLEKLVPDEYAAHWQDTLKFLSILTETWPALLDARGVIDKQQRVNRALALQAERWLANPPGHRVVAAGSTGSRPATADLLAVVAGLRHGSVVLPGLDLELDADSWAALDPAHPQYGLKKLLDRLGVSRAQVRPLTPAPDPRAGRLRLVSEAMRPAATCDAWRDLPGFGPETLAGVARLDAPGPREEAGAIAMILREALEEDGRTAALVTPDRNLARRVAGELARWGVVIDDSAGQPLPATEPGAFLRLMAEMVADGFAPHTALACLKHPLAAGGMDPGHFRTMVRRLELRCLRGPRPAPGVAGLMAAVRDDRLLAFLRNLDTVTQDFTALMAEPTAPLSQLVRAHMELAESLAASHDLPGPARLWKGEAGEALAEFAAELGQAAELLGDIPTASYPALLDALLAGRAVRPAWGSHPRLNIWGPLEARLQHADLMVLGGLNEDTWPAAPDADPWMSRPMRERFGLPPHERRIGLSAHDFVQALGAPRVVLSRAARVDGSPTVPSRWLLRLDAVMGAAGLSFDEDAGQFLDWHSRLDAPAAPPKVERPAPRPPVEARPREVWVTEVESWMRDPYGLYAKKILGLKALKPIDADPGAADYGTLVHTALERFLQAYPKELPPDAEERLVAIGRDVFEDAMAAPGIWAFWWPRFVSVARWVVAQENERRGRVREIFTETVGRLAIDAPAGPLTVAAKADRIEVLKDGGLALIDYKTGAPPSPKEVAAGYAPQLPLEAAIAWAGGFENIPAAAPAEMAFWRLKGGAEGGEQKPAGDDPEQLARDALDGLKALAAAFDDPNTPYEARPHPEHAPKYSDYLHLARIREWAAAGDEGEE